MIVIAIIGLLIGVGSIAWGAMIRSGNETSAAQTLDRIRTYQAQYASRNRGKFATFDQLVTAAGLDEKFTGDRPVVNGYVFTLTLEEPSSASRHLIKSTQTRRFRPALPLPARGSFTPIRRSARSKPTTRSPRKPKTRQFNFGFWISDLGFAIDRFRI